MVSRRLFVRHGIIGSIALLLGHFVPKPAKTKTRKDLPAMDEVREFCGVRKGQKFNHWTELCPQDCPKIKSAIDYDNYFKRTNYCYHKLPRKPCWWDCDKTLCFLFEDQIIEGGGRIPNNYRTRYS